MFFNPWYVCHDIDINILWPASFVKFPWHYWTEFGQSWKDLMKTLRSHGNLQSLKDLINGANIGSYAFKFKRLVILNVRDVKNEFIDEQANAIFERCVNSIFYLFKKWKKYDSKVRAYHCSIMYQVHLSLTELRRQCCTDFQTVCLFHSGKDRCTWYMWSNDMFVLLNFNLMKFHQI